MVIPSLIAGGATLIGGIMGNAQENRNNQQSQANMRLQRKWAINDTMNQFVRLRKAAEKAGYNPAAVLGAGSGVPSAVGSPSFSSSNFLGQAIAEAGLVAADSMEAVEAQKAQTDSALAENQTLRKKLNHQTLQPRVAGVYAQAVEVPTADAAMGVTYANGPIVDPVDLFVPTRSASGTVGSGVSSDSPDLEQLAGGYVQSYLIDSQSHRDAASKTKSPFGRYIGGFLKQRSADAFRDRGQFVYYDDYGRTKITTIPKRRPHPDDIVKMKTFGQAYVGRPDWHNQEPPDFWGSSRR